MHDFDRNQAIDIEVPDPVEVPESPVAPEILPPHERPIPLTDPPPSVVPPIPLTDPPPPVVEARA